MGSLGHASDASAEGDTPSNASTASAFSESNSPPASPLAALLKMRCEMSGSSYAMFWERSTRGGVPVLTVAGGYVTPARKASLVRMGMSDSYPDACRDVVLDEAGDNMVAKALRSKEAIHIENVSTCPSFVRRDKAARYGIQSITFLATAGGVIEYGTVHSQSTLKVTLYGKCIRALTFENVCHRPDHAWMFPPFPPLEMKGWRGCPRATPTSEASTEVAAPWS